MSANRSRAHPVALSALVLFTSFNAGCRKDASEAQRPASQTFSSRAASQAVSPGSDSIDWNKVDQAMGRTGKQETGGVYRYSLPRSDLTVTCQGVKIKPALSLGAWIAFRPTSANTAIAMGDLVLTEGEYNRVIARLVQGGVTPTAVHKHLPAHSPALWWTHVEAKGNPIIVAQTVRAALLLTGIPATRSGPAQQQALTIDTAAIHQALGYEGKLNGGVYQVSIPRSETVRADGIDLPGPMGTATALNFQPTSSGKAAINGDLVLRAEEVEAVEQALEGSGIQLVALHNHMLDEEPRLFFLHFWANDDAVKLAHGLRAALDKMSVKRSPA